MLETIAIVLVVLWVLGLFAFHLGAFIHILIVAAIVVFAFRLLTGRKAAV